MDCVIRVIKGADQGSSTDLQPGPNLIGRSDAARLRLSSPEISWEHLLITRNGQEYHAENLSASGTFIDDARIVGQVRLRPRTQLRVGDDTVLRFEPAPGEDGGLFARRGVLVALLVAVSLIGLAVIFMPERNRGGNDNWDLAYHALDDWLSSRAAAGRLPSEAPNVFREAWRLEKAEDYQNSQHQWLRVKMLVEGLAEQRRLSFDERRHHDALEALLQGQTPASLMDDERAATALLQFATRRLAFSSTKAREGAWRW